MLVRCELADGTTGWGEGVPRSYVTGETPDGCLAQLAATPLAEQLAADCSSWPDVIELCERFQPALDRDDPRGCYGNALRCAVELSILDAFGQLFGEPVSAVVASLSRQRRPMLADRRLGAIQRRDRFRQPRPAAQGARPPAVRLSRLQSESRRSRRRRCRRAAHDPPLDRPAHGPATRRERSLARGRAARKSRTAR